MTTGNALSSAANVNEQCLDKAGRRVNPSGERAELRCHLSGLQPKKALSTTYLGVASVLALRTCCPCEAQCRTGINTCPVSRIFKPLQALLCTLFQPDILH